MKQLTLENQQIVLKAFESSCRRTRDACSMLAKLYMDDKDLSPTQVLALRYIKEHLELTPSTDQLYTELVLRSNDGAVNWPAIRTAQNSFN